MRLRELLGDAEVAEAPEELKDFSGTIVHLFPARDGGKYPLQTVEAFRASKAPGTNLVFAVVDDSSKDGCCDALEGQEDVVLLRTPRGPRGQGIARSRAVEATRHLSPRAYISTDCHMGPYGVYPLERLALSAEETSGVVQSLSGVLDPPKRLGWRGCKWDVKRVKGIVRVETTHDYRIKGGPLLATEVLAGACYAFTPATYDRLGGFGEFLGLYGFFERDIAIRGYFLGIPQLCDTRACLLHRYQSKRDYPTNDVWRVASYIHCFRGMWRPEVWEEVWKPWAELQVRKFRDPLCEYLMDARWLLDLQHGFEARKFRSDEEVLAWMRIPE